MRRIMCLMILLLAQSHSLFSQNSSDKTFEIFNSVKWIGNSFTLIDQEEDISFVFTPNIPYINTLSLKYKNLAASVSFNLPMSRDRIEDASVITDFYDIDISYSFRSFSFELRYQNAVGYDSSYRGVYSIPSPDLHTRLMGFNTYYFFGDYKSVVNPLYNRGDVYQYPLLSLENIVIYASINHFLIENLEDYPIITTYEDLSSLNFTIAPGFYQQVNFRNFFYLWSWFLGASVNYKMCNILDGDEVAELALGGFVSAKLGCGYMGDIFTAAAVLEIKVDSQLASDSIVNLSSTEGFIKLILGLSF